MTASHDPSADTTWNGTYAADSTAPAITFEAMAALVREMTREPILKEIRVHPAAYPCLVRFIEELKARDQQHLGQPRPEPPVNVYAGVPVRIDKALKPGQWRAIDTDGRVMDEGNFLPEHLRW